jgi:hypothetical protein
LVVVSCSTSVKRDCLTGLSRLNVVNCIAGKVCLGRNAATPLILGFPDPG